MAALRVELRAVSMAAQLVATSAELSVDDSAGTLAGMWGPG